MHLTLALSSAHVKFDVWTAPNQHDPDKHQWFLLSLFNFIRNDKEQFDKPVWY